jgi:predicted nucleotidyltransferase
MRTTRCARDFVSRENEETMTLQELRTTKRDEILLIAARRGARNVRVFGPVAQGDDDERSDIDFLVDLEPDRSLFDRSGLLIDLEAEVIPYGQETATLQD